MHAGRRVEDLPTPAFTVDLDVVKKNTREMAERFRALGVNLRPHMKTHKTLEGGDLMTGGTRRQIVVSTLAEARFFADGGFDDILYAYPLPFDKVDECAALTERLESFHVLVDSPEALALLKRRPLHGGKHWKVWLKVDCENGRAGLRHADPAALELAQAIAAGPTELAGVYAHCGNSYHCQGVPEIQTVARTTTKQVLEFTEKLREEGVPCPMASIGSTPSCSHPVPEMAELQEVHPGNYIFYDVQQMRIGSCQLKDIAVRVLTRVIGHYPHRNQMLVDCGWTGLSLHSLGQLPTGYALVEGHPNLKYETLALIQPSAPSGSRQLRTFAGRISTSSARRLRPRAPGSGFFQMRVRAPNHYTKTPSLQSTCASMGWLVGMTQEHGRIEPVTGKLDFTQFPLGTLLALIPYHACATAAMHPTYYVHVKGQVLATWKPARGW